MAVIVNGFQATPAGSGTDGDTLLVTGTGIIAYDGDPAIFMSGDDQQTTVFGEVYSTTGRAILSQGLNAKVYVAEGANVSGATAIQTGDNGFVQNAGTLHGQIYMPSGNLENTGTILGYIAIYFGGSITNYGDMLSYVQVDTRGLQQTFSVYNSGHMRSFDSRAYATNFENRGLVDSFYCENTLTLTNTGTIGSLRFDDGAGTIFNHGFIGGQTIYFSSAGDFYNGRDGVIEGAIRAGDGNDIILTGAADDTIYGEAGNDTLDGGIGADTMNGGPGDDIYVVDNIGDVVTELVGAGNDTVRTKLDTYALGVNFENMIFIGSGDFIGAGNNLNNVITGGAGNDRLIGGAGNDALNGRAGNDVLNGGTGVDAMSGGADNDIYFVDNPLDKVNEAIGGGSDTVYASVNYTLQVGQGVEFLRANAGATGLILTGNAFNNTVVGLGGNDTLAGGNGNDTLNGGAGIDRLAGGAGKDNLTGGLGPDSFIFDTALNAVTNIDHIFDFSSIDDKILLNQSIFTAAGAPGTLAAGAFFVGAGAHDADDRIIYRSGTGALIYDSNGNIAGGATQFATLSPGLGLSNANFVIV